MTETSPFTVDNSGKITVDGKTLGQMNSSAIWGLYGAKLFEGEPVDLGDGKWVKRFQIFLESLANSGHTFSLEELDGGKKVQLKWEANGDRTPASPSSTKSEVKVAVSQGTKKRR